MITLYTLPCCPRCETLKQFFVDNNKAITIRAMDTAESITELRVNGRFDMIAPVLQIGEEDFLGSDEMFPNGELDIALISKVISHSA